MILSSALKKTHGAFFTPTAVAQFLTHWAIRSSEDTVMDPSAGDGVFLLAAADRLQQLGGGGGDQVFGIEIRSDSSTAAEAEAESRGVRVKLLEADFFTFNADESRLVDAVIGNPPFIRYQRFTGASRDRALVRAREAGVQLSALTSSWAPFLVHAAQFVRPGGRLAVVAPAELAHASYAQPLIKHFCDAFQKVSIVTFDKRVFSDLGEDTVLLMCEGKGRPFQNFTLKNVLNMDALAASVDAVPAVVMDARAVSAGAVRMVQYLLPLPARALYEELRRHPQVVRLGDIADVGIGYVTGANDFFHLSRAETKALQIDRRFLKPAVRRGAEFEGLSFTRTDWRLSREAGRKNSLLYLNAHTELSSSLRRYLAGGRREGIADRYKCRTREPWYAVPHVYVGDAFLTYMSGDEPRLVVNDAGVVAPNTLHVIKMRKPTPIDSWDLAAAWQSSLTKLSCELCGHSLGGGMLKLEPSEAQNVLIPVNRFGQSTVRRLDLAGRNSLWKQVVADVDARTASVLDLSMRDMKILKDATELLKNRRTRR